MSVLKLVGLSGNITNPSKTRRLVETALAIAGQRLDSETYLIELADFGDHLGQARKLDDLDAKGRNLIAKLLAADALVVATPIYKASYPGLFKHLI
ncbi:MAG: NAD(P)H-dependent oxidoreductase, partial [Candidatus Saccharibacteria bacterium]|nr:NAD(P)H-dependent oxidoreductase [Pseudorhodobacter sp.]